MSLINTSDQKPIGVVGAGSFGTAIANILAEKNQVLLYARDTILAEQFEKTRKVGKQLLHQNVSITNDIKQLAQQCNIIFPIVPSANFRDMMQSIAPYLHPYHILIHGTKGFDIQWPQHGIPTLKEHVKTMSQVICEESVVVRIGCLAGPNLAAELAQKQPAATVIASHFEEVVDIGSRLLRNDRFQVYGSEDLKGIELCGALKNIIAIASGILIGLGFGENARALLVSRGLVELIYIGKLLGGNTQAFIGLAGVGDLVATCFSSLSRNFNVGFQLAQGKKLPEIVNNMEETAEGVFTIKIIKKLIENYTVRAPITEALYRVLFEELDTQEALAQLMKYPFNTDIDFL